MGINPSFSLINGGKKLLFLLYGWLEKLRINSASFHTHPPILVYQMGKVGSTSITRMLKQSSVKNPVFHLHWFSDQGLSRAEKIKQSSHDPRFSLHLKRCKLLRSKFDSGAINKLKVITLVRDPIAREISSFFQNLELTNTHLIDQQNQLKTDVAVKLIEKKITCNLLDIHYCLNWFDQEFNPALCLNIYDYPFNQQKGYSIISMDNIDVLVLKLEKLDSCYGQALEEFLDIQLSGPSIKANRGDQKKYSHEREMIKKYLQLSPEACQNIYSTRFVKHFYSQDERDTFIARWSRQTKD